MKPHPATILFAIALAVPAVGTWQAPRPPLEQRIAHSDPSRYRASSGVHGGPGRLNFFALFGGDVLDTNLWFLHRGVIEPKSGIGAHFHNNCEEMFVILDGEAQFTIDGRTSTLKGPAGAPTRMGHSHAIYNATDQPVQWLNINVTAFRGVYDAFDLSDGRVGAALDAIPQFMTMSLDPSRLQPVEGMHGRQGHGAVPTRAPSERVHVDVGLRRSPAAAGRHVRRARIRGGDRRLLLRDARRPAPRPSTRRPRRLRPATPFPSASARRRRSRTRAASRSSSSSSVSPAT